MIIRTETDYFHNFIGSLPFVTKAQCDSCEVAIKVFYII
jgi:hypothetical protein